MDQVRQSYETKLRENEQVCTSLKDYVVLNEVLKDYCRTVVLQAQFTVGGHFVWNITTKHFYNPSILDIIANFPPF